MTTSTRRRFQLWTEQKGECAYCARVCDHECRGTIDHVIPRCRGGRNTRENMVFACRQCNAAKGDKLPDDPRWLKTRARLTEVVKALRGSPFKPKADRLADLEKTTPHPKEA